MADDDVEEVKMTGAEVVAAVRSSDRNVRARALKMAEEGDVEKLDADTVAFAFGLTVSKSKTEASAGGSLVQMAVIEGHAIDPDVWTKALQTSVAKQNLVRAAIEYLDRHGALPASVAAALPTRCDGEDDGAWTCGDALARQAIAADDAVLMGRIVEDLTEYWNRGIGVAALDAAKATRTPNATLVELLEHVRRHCKNGFVTNEAGKFVAEYRAAGFMSKDFANSGAPGAKLAAQAAKPATKAANTPVKKAPAKKAPAKKAPAKKAPAKKAPAKKPVKKAPAANKKRR